MSKIKTEENDDTESAGEPPAFAAALGLHRVGTKLPPKPQPSQPIQVLNARGMPARIRKKNKLFFDDDIVNDVKPLVKTSPTKRATTVPTKTTTPVKGSPSIMSNISSSSKKRKIRGSPTKLPTKTTPTREISGRLSKSLFASNKRIRPDIDSDSDEDDNDDDGAAGVVEVKEECPTADRKVCQKIGYKLRNLLKLPKAHKFVSYEWFYSSIDKPLFDGENDFQVCLRESFPLLKTRMLTRVEWSKIRQMMGKPRRCSSKFFEEERGELERKRQKIRLLQSRKYGDVSFVRDLPKVIPLPLSVGCKVTARIRRPQDGLFSGIIEAVDSTNNSYRISFDRTGLGPLNIPDFEVLANEPHDTIPLESLTQKFRPRGNVPLYVASSLKKPGVPLSASKGDPLLIANNFNHKYKLKMPKDRIGGFPLKLLEMIVRTRKSISSKHAKLIRLKEMNHEAEMYKSYGEDFPDDFQRKYASIVIGMDKINRDIQDHLNEIQTHSKQIIRESQHEAILTPTYLREKCRHMGEQSFDKNNKEMIEEPRMKELISNLAMIMWVVSNLSKGEENGQVLNAVEACLEDVKKNLNPENIGVFQKEVQIHLHHIQVELRQSIGSAPQNGITSNNNSLNATVTSNHNNSTIS